MNTSHNFRGGGAVFCLTNHKVLPADDLFLPNHPVHFEKNVKIILLSLTFG